MDGASYEKQAVLHLAGQARAKSVTCKHAWPCIQVRTRRASWQRRRSLISEEHSQGIVYPVCGFLYLIHHCSSLCTYMGCLKLRDRKKPDGL